MSESITGTTKKKGRPKTTGIGQQIQVRMHEPLLKQIDEWASQNIADSAKRTRPEAIRQILTEFLQNGEIRL